jgi:hypothetical protein
MTIEGGAEKKPLSDSKLIDLAEELVERARTSYAGEYRPKLRQLANAVEEYETAFKHEVQTGGGAQARMREELEGRMRQLDMTAVSLLGSRDWKRSFP